MDIVAPGDVIAELNRLRDLAEKGVQAIYDAEVKVAEAEAKLDSEYAKAYIRHSGTVALREQLAALDSAPFRLDRDIARAELNRVKLKMKSISDAMVAVSVIAKQVEMMWRA
jgi:multidrug efflux pump subunit AcrA (membrane-fusion protein)